MAYSLFSIFFSSFLLDLQLGHHGGYVKVNWKGFEKDLDKAKKGATKELEKRATMLHGIIDEVGIELCAFRPFVLYEWNRHARLALHFNK